MRRLIVAIRKLWYRIIGREWITAGEYYMPVERMAQPVAGIRKKAGTVVSIRNAIRRAKSLRPPKRRQRDIGREHIQKIMATKGGE
ncbi:hypothetical protein LCGC14_2177120 [marine sediment metagenome]|uniref:Uncharacterized protein n=1 Tax=marine sediment metagenome TaxID=412755 RepID=A0A0F9DNC6_9ZZZZ